MLTKNDIAAIRKANDICVHLSARNPQGLVRLIKRKRYDAKPFETDQEHVMTANVVMDSLRGQAAFESGTADCFAMAGIYHDQRVQVSNVLKTLRVGDEVTFEFSPDAHTNGYIAAAGLHGDALYLRVRRNGKFIARWELTSSVCPSNSARMCRGVPDSDTYARDAAEARKIA
jgi:cold shock CspA family protein